MPYIELETPTIDHLPTMAKRMAQCELPGFVVRKATWDVVEKLYGDPASYIFSEAVEGELHSNSTLYVFNGYGNRGTHVDEIAEDLVKNKGKMMFNIHEVVTEETDVWMAHTRPGYYDYFTDGTPREPIRRFNYELTADLREGRVPNPYVIDDAVFKTRLAEGDRALFAERTATDPNTPNVLHMFIGRSPDRYSQTSRYFVPQDAAATASL